MTTHAVAIAGSGDLSRYFAEEFAHRSNHEVHLISRSERSWCSDLARTVSSFHFHQVKDYTSENLLPLMDEFGIVAIVSAISTDEAEPFVRAHGAMLDACRRSKTCKRLIPSDYSGDVEKFPDLPRPYADTRHAFRRTLAAQSDVEWTSVNGGWLTDYFVRFPSGPKTYIKEFGAFALNLAEKTAVIPGTGNEKTTWTCARDIAKAVVQLMGHPKWE